MSPPKKADTKADTKAEASGPGLVPHPLLSVLVAATWLLAQNSLYIGHIILAVGLGIALPRLTHGFWPGAPRLKRPGVALRLLGVFSYDILVANFHVARLVLGPNDRLRPGFLEVPLDIADEFGIALLASMVTLTPGTVSADLDDEHRVLLVHALDIDDADAMVALIKSRYERPLQEALGC